MLSQLRVPPGPVCLVAMVDCILAAPPRYPPEKPALSPEQPHQLEHSRYCKSSPQTGTRHLKLKASRHQSFHHHHLLRVLLEPRQMKRCPCRTPSPSQAHHGHQNLGLRIKSLATKLFLKRCDLYFLTQHFFKTCYPTHWKYPQAHRTSHLLHHPCTTYSRSR